MSKVYYFRHQAAGVMYEFPFTEAPSELQLAPLRKLCAARYGDTHPKTSEKFWGKVVDYEVVSGIPKVEQPAEGGPPPGRGSAGSTEFQISGTGTVRNP